MHRLEGGEAAMFPGEHRRQREHDVPGRFKGLVQWPGAEKRDDVRWWWGVEGYIS